METVSGCVKFGASQSSLIIFNTVVWRVGNDGRRADSE